MDNLTHSLLGTLIGQAGLKRKTGLAMPALIVGANLPDVDAACFLWLDGVGHLGFRRGITHGPPALVLLPLISAVLFYAYDRWQAQRGTRPSGRLPVRFVWLFLLCFIACLTHPALDWLNVYGIRLLEPFSQRWFYGDVLFIVDVWLWALMGGAAWLSFRRERRGDDWRRPARIAIAMALGYIGFNAAITCRAERSSDDDAVGRTIAKPVPLAFWKRDLIIPLRDGRYRIVPGWTGTHAEAVRSQIIGNADLVRACGRTHSSVIDPQAEAFLFWSRAPLFEQGRDGSILLRDARFYDPVARERFTVSLPAAPCAPRS